MDKREGGHVVLDGDKIFVSQDLIPIFQFLIEIDKELESFLGFEKKLESIRVQHLEMLNVCSFLVRKLVENNIDFGEFRFAEKPETIAEKLELHLPIRSQMIVLFANLEVLFALNIAYQNQTDDDNFIRNEMARSKKAVRQFLKNYCLSDKNEWYRKNKNWFLVSPWEFRKFRNSLTHFFSVSAGISISPEAMKSQANETREALVKTGNNISFISPEDLREITKGAFILMMKSWNEDSLSRPEDFLKRIQMVQSVVKKNGSVLMRFQEKN